MPYAIEEFAGDDADDNLVAVWGSNLHLEADAREKYRWYYRRNPQGQGTAFLLTWRSEDGTPRVVGSAGLGCRLFRHGGETLSTGLLADFAVDREHRTLLPALSLQRSVLERARAGKEWLYGFPNAAALGVFLRLGYHKLGELADYVGVLRLAPYVHRRTGSHFLARSAGLAWDLVTRLTSRRKRAREPGAWRTEVRLEPDARFDRLWEETRGREAGFVGCRSADFLRWRFVEKPGERSEIVTLVDEVSRLRAYAVVLTHDPTEAVVGDFWAASKEELAGLMHRLRPLLRARGFAAVRIPFFGARWVTKLLRDCGYRRRPGGRAVVLKWNETRTGLDGARFGDPESWFLTHADEDN